MSGTGGRPPRAVLAAGVLLAVTTVLSLLPERSSGTDVPSSSYSTGPTGAGAYAQLLRRFGHPVDRLRGDLDLAGVKPGATLVILDAGLSGEEAGMVGRFVRDGGRLVAGGAEAGGWLGDVVEGAPRFEAAPVREAVPAAAAPENEGIGAVRCAGLGSFAAPGQLEPLLVERDGAAVVAVAGAVGAGRVVVLADTTPLSNLLLGTADNAAFGLALAGPAGTPVAFAEGPHGFRSAQGWSALPGPVRTALAGLALAAAVWLLARSRRLGPPEEEVRALAPRRRAYVDALAATLARTGRVAEAAEPVRARARLLVAQRAGLPGDAPDDLIRPAALRLGLPADEAEALVGIRDGPGVLAAGRALARLEQQTGVSS